MVVCEAAEVLCLDHVIDVVRGVCLFSVGEIVRLFRIISESVVDLKAIRKSDAYLFNARLLVVLLQRLVAAEGLCWLRGLLNLNAQLYPVVLFGLDAFVCSVVAHRSVHASLFGERGGGVRV